MRKIYEGEMRALEETLLREDFEEHGNRTFEVPTTGAQLDFDNAISHLYHFCSRLSAKDIVDLRPEFICEESEGLVQAKVILPLLVIEEVRTAESEQFWMSEKNAIKDASSVAYKALHHACLVNDNLLPLLPPDSAIDELISSSVEMRVSIVNVREQLNPWVEIARAWQRPEGTVYESKITVGELQMKTWLPTPVPKLSPFHTYWDAETTFAISLSTSASIAINLETMLKAWDDTWALLNTAFGSMFAIQQNESSCHFSRISIFLRCSRWDGNPSQTTFSSGMNQA
jgi:hypothetical protein